MPKMKTNSSAKKRFKVTGSGKIMRRKAFHSHILTKKDKDTKKQMTHDTEVHKSDMPRVKRMLCK
ncbi:MAG: 50S ribosomal protein L35 [Chitinophagales bacterium]|nr:50S ribosomal protein L35 [Chitinophagales bacterium]